jgi:hypothetical protein
MVAWCRALLLLNATLLWSWLLLCVALYAVLLEAGWNALFFEVDRSNGFVGLLPYVAWYAMLPEAGWITLLFKAG